MLFTPIPILVYQLFPSRPGYLAAATAAGVFAGLAQVVGLLRWPFLVPTLADAYRDPNASPARRDAVLVVFEAFHRFAGGAIGEHIGYLLTALWSLLLGAAIVQTGFLPSWLGWIGIVTGLGILYGVLEEVGVESAATVNAISYIVWSLWLIALGAAILLR
jgi:hypothetical protein